MQLNFISISLTKMSNKLQILAQVCLLCLVFVDKYRSLKSGPLGLKPILDNVVHNPKWQTLYLFCTKHKRGRKKFITITTGINVKNFVM
jgi:hypothetical protein